MLRRVESNKIELERHIREVAIESGYNTDSYTYDNDNWDGTLEAKTSLYYYKIGRLVICYVTLWIGKDNLEEDCPKNSIYQYHLLPYPFSSPSNGYIFIPMGVSQKYMTLNISRDLILFNNVRGVGSVTTIFSYLTD